MHTLLIGRSGSGKSALAKQLGSSLREHGETVLAFNPTGERGYTRRDAFGCAAADWETYNPDLFIQKVVKQVRKRRKFFVIIDEAHEMFPHSKQSDHLWIATRGRHHGINIIGCSQRGALINPTFRGQCSTIYLFKCSMTDAKFMADDFGDKELLNAMKLKPGQYYRLTIDSIDRGEVFKYTPTIVTATNPDER